MRLLGRPLLWVGPGALLLGLGGAWYFAASAPGTTSYSAAPPTRYATIPLPRHVVHGSAKMVPSVLPRSKPAPVALTTTFSSAERNSRTVPELTKISIEVARNVVFNASGLPSCPRLKLLSNYSQPRQTCGASLIGHGTVESEVTLPGEAPATVSGRLLAYYEFAVEKQWILALVTTSSPRPLSYVIPFEIAHARPPYGTRLVEPKMHRVIGKCRRPDPACYEGPGPFRGIYGHISKFELTLGRRFSYGGKRESFVSATCPASGHRPSTLVSLEHIELRYADGTVERSVLGAKCRVSGT
jgi:hypothetical protein